MRKNNRNCSYYFKRTKKNVNINKLNLLFYLFIFILLKRKVNQTAISYLAAIGSSPVWFELTPPVRVPWVWTRSPAYFRSEQCTGWSDLPTPACEWERKREIVRVEYILKETCVSGWRLLTRAGGQSG